MVVNASETSGKRKCRKFSKKSTLNPGHKVSQKYEVTIRKEKSQNTQGNKLPSAKVRRYNT